MIGKLTFLWGLIKITKNIVFFVVCEVIRIENVRSAKSGPQRIRSLAPARVSTGVYVCGVVYHTMCTVCMVMMVVVCTLKVQTEQNSLV
jgi:hypothetical protein